MTKTTVELSTPLPEELQKRHDDPFRVSDLGTKNHLLQLMGLQPLRRKLSSKKKKKRLQL